MKKRLPVRAPLLVFLAGGAAAALWMFGGAACTTTLKPATPTITPSATSSSTATPVSTSTQSRTYSRTQTPTVSGTPTPSGSPTTTATVSVTSTQSATGTSTSTPLPFNVGLLAVGGGTNFSLTTAEYFNPNTTSWVTKASMLTASAGLGAAPVTIGGVGGVLAVGGVDIGSLTVLSAAEFYDPGLNSWSAVTSMPSALAALAAAPATVGGVLGVLAIGGTPDLTTFPATASFYNPTINSWVSVPPGIGRGYLAAAPVTISGTAGVLAVGGYDGSSYLSYAQFYSSTGGWTTEAFMPTARAYLAAAPVTISGVTGVLAVGGSANGSTGLSTAEFYNPNTTSWSTMPSMPTARMNLAAAAVAINGINGVLAVGGAGPVATAEFYNPVTNSWSTMPSMPTAREYLAASN